MTTEIHEIGKVDIKEANRIAFMAIGKSGLDKFFEFKGRQSCIVKAQAKPLPGASADAFIKGATKVAGEVVREVFPIHIACLQAVESPVLTLVQQASESKEKKANADFSEEQQWEVCYIFTADPKSLRKDLKDGGKELIKSKSEESVSEWNAAKINMVILAVIEQFHRHVQTSVKFAAEVEQQGDSSFFQALKESQKKPVEQAG